MADPTAPSTHDEPAAAAPALAKPRWRLERSFLWMAVEVVLISASVFLGLAGQQWLENRERREQAADALRRFRAEIVANQAQVKSRLDYHLALAKALDTYFAADETARKDVPIPFDKGLNPTFFEKTAWDLALATQSLAYISQEVAYVLSRIYYFQDVVNALTALMTETLYLRPPVDGPDGQAFLRAADSYYGDLSGFEPGLLEMYDVALKAIDQELEE